MLILFSKNAILSFIFVTCLALVSIITLPSSALAKTHRTTHAPASVLLNTRNSPALKDDLLIKLGPNFNDNQSFLHTLMQLQATQQLRFEPLPYSWILVFKPNSISTNILLTHPAVEQFQDDKLVSIKEDYQVEDPLRRAAYLRSLSNPARNKHSNSSASDSKNTSKDMASNANTEELNAPGESATARTDYETAEAAYAQKPLLPIKKVRVGIVGPGVDYRDLSLVPCLGTTNKNGAISVGWDYVKNQPWPKEDTKNLKELFIEGGNAGLGTFINQQICQAQMANDKTSNNVSSSDTGSTANESLEKIDLLNFKVINQNGQGKTSDILRGLEEAVNSGVSLLVLGFYQKFNEVNVALDDAVSFVKEKSVFVINDQLLRKLHLSEDSSGDVTTDLTMDDPALHFQMQGRDLQWDYNSLQKVRLTNILTQQLAENPFLFSNTKLDMDTRLEAAAEKLSKNNKALELKTR